MSDFDDLAPCPSRIAEIVADPEAERWARDCGWLPGIGHCRNRPCSTACPFHVQRLAEVRRILRWCRNRRPTQ
jgi:hypothetical protein